jgi:pentose-5-phosphate-3-epimerase
VKRQMDQGKEWINRKVDRQIEIDGPISRKTTYKKIDRGADGQTVRRKS